MLKGRWKGRARGADSLGDIPEPLLQWCAECAPALPPSMRKAATFYAAMRASQRIEWQRKLDQFMALHVWATLALTGDVRTRPYMAKLIHDKQSGFHWTAHRGGFATKCAMLALDRDYTRDQKRDYLQHRDGAARALREAREHLHALERDIVLWELMPGPDMRKLRRVIKRFMVESMTKRRDKAHAARASSIERGGDVGESVAASFGEMLKIRGDKIPTLCDMLDTAQGKVSAWRAPPTDRHAARAQYLRALFADTHGSAIESHRVAFCTHAAHAVFGERVDKRTVRRLVADIVKAESESAKRRAAEAAEWGEA
jgi:hypothetical protein